MNSRPSAPPWMASSYQMRFSQTGDAIPDDYSERIKRLKARLGLSQLRLSEIMGISQAAVSRWESGQSRPSLEAWQQIRRGEEFGLEGLRLSTPTDRSLAEARAEYTTTPPPLDFTTNPELVRLVAEGKRLTYGHLFNPAFAAEISKIDPLPHQRIAVYEHMVPQNRLRFLLADDAGAGKTIMAGLYLREMLARRLIRRVLVVPPAGLVSNWERELRTLFNLSFRVVSGSDVRVGNPFAGPDSNALIVSVDTLAGERVFARLQASEVDPYDLVIFDEAHKLSAYREPDMTLRRTDRYRLAEALAGVSIEEPRWRLGWSAHHLLLLTATPHMGKEFPYYCLWRLLEPEALSTFDAFNAYPGDARRQHFIRRTKEEMVRFNGLRIYPMREANTPSYDLSSGEISEQTLYDQTTDYIRFVYNRARILNRSAARLAMSIFQRRLASSTWAMRCSFKRRLERLDELIHAIQSGELTPEELEARQHRLNVQDVLDETTGDEESAEDGREQNQAAEERAMAGVVARTLTELQSERDRVSGLFNLSERVYNKGDESKFEKLKEVITDPRYENEKLLIFTEHRDTLDFLVRRLEGIGYAGQVAQIHGGMGTRPDVSSGLSERDEQVEFFRKSTAEGGARFLVATDAAGEGINLQFCWLMINYDIPWNPARLEQRMGRVHRYKQAHDPVLIFNLVAGKTREGRVLKTLLDKLERIRRELGSDKVFDVVGQMLEGISLKELMERVLTDSDPEAAIRDVGGTLTNEQVDALRARELQLYGYSGDVASRLPDQNEQLKREEMRRLLPGYVRRFIEQAAARLDLALDGDLDRIFKLRALKPMALDPFWPVLEAYPAEARNRLSFQRPTDREPAVFLHPGEPFFDRVQALVDVRFGPDALRGGVFVDPYAEQPYFFHLALVSIVRAADPSIAGMAREETLEYRLVGLRHPRGGELVAAPVESLLLLRGGQGLPPAALAFSQTASESVEQARAFAHDRVAGEWADARRQALLAALPEREGFITRGYAFEEGELADMRRRFKEKAAAGDQTASANVARVRERQQKLNARRDSALAALRREPELIGPGVVTFLAHALVVTSSDPEDLRQHDIDVEQIAVRRARAHEEAHGARVKDVSTSPLALAAGLGAHPGFDLLSERSRDDERYVEVKGRAGSGDVELTENEWAQACNHRGKYWLYIVFDCASPDPDLQVVQDPFKNLLVKSQAKVRISARDIYAAAQSSRES